MKLFQSLVHSLEFIVNHYLHNKLQLLRVAWSLYAYLDLCCNESYSYKYICFYVVLMFCIVLYKTYKWRELKVKILWTLDNPLFFSRDRCGVLCMPKCAPEGFFGIGNVGLTFAKLYERKNRAHVNIQGLRIIYHIIWGANELSSSCALKPHI